MTPRQPTPEPLTVPERDRLQHLIRRAARHLSADERGRLLRLWEQQQAAWTEPCTATPPSPLGWDRLGLGPCIVAGPHVEHRDAAGCSWRPISPTDREEQQVSDHYGAQVRERLADARAELAALHEGEEPYEDERLVPTPGQWITLWNRATPQQRLECAERLLAAGERAWNCMLGLHEERLAERWEELMAKKLRAEEAEARVAAARALAADMRTVLAYEGPRHAHLRAGVWDDTGDPCDHCALIQRLRDGLAALDGPNSQPAPSSPQAGSCPYDYHDMTGRERGGIPCMCQLHGAGGAYGCPEGCPTHDPGGEDVPEGAIGGPDTDGLS